MRFARLLKSLIRVPACTGLVVATLALGIGANAAIFGVINGVLLKPLSFPEPDQLVDVDHSAPGVNIERAGAAAFLYFTYREQSRSFQDIGMWTSETFSLTGIGNPEEVRGLDVTDGVLPILGVRPAWAGCFHDKTTRPGAPRPWSSPTSSGAPGSEATDRSLGAASCSTAGRGK